MGSGSDRQALIDAAVNLLDAVWRGIPATYKSRYRSSIWTQFEENVRAAAYTSNLAQFVERLRMRLGGASLGRNAKERKVAAAVLSSGNDRELLRLIRSETTYLVLMVRLRNQQRKAEWEERKKIELGEQEIEFEEE